MATEKQAEKSADLPNITFDTPWRATFRLDKVKTAVTDSKVDGAPEGSKFAYPLLTVTVLDPGTAKVTKGQQYLLHGHPASLMQELRRIQPPVTSTFTVDYQGRKSLKNGNNPHIFECDAPSVPAFNWGDGPSF